MTNKPKQKSWKKHHTAHPARAWALEARLMFDAAGVADAVHQLSADTDTHVLDLRAAEATRAAAVALPAGQVAEAEVATAGSSSPGTAATGADKPSGATERLVAEALAQTERSAGPSSTSGASHEILFIDGRIPGLDVLVSHVRSDVQVVVLDAESDPWAQMTAVIESQQGIGAIHLVSHGQSGDIMIGGQHYTQASLQAHAGELAQWQCHLAAGADILLYGCDIGAGASGQTLIDTLAGLTQADVAASSNATGATVFGGDWTLEVHSSGTSAASFDHALVFAPSVATDYTYNLTAGVFSSTTGTNVDTAGVTTGLIGAGKQITFDPITVSTTDAVAKLVIRAYDVDYGLKNSSGVAYAAGDPASEWDGVYIQRTGDATWTFVGYLNGTNNNWSYTTLDISSVIAAKGTGSYIVRVTPDDNGTQTQASNGGRWVVGTSIAEVILGSGGAVLNTVSESGQSVTSTLTPVTSGNFTIQYLLIDSTGRAVAQVDAAANGLTAGTAATLSSTLNPNSNFYSSWSALPSGTYKLQATLFDSKGVVQDTKEVSYALVRSGASSSSGGVLSSSSTSSNYTRITGNTSWTGSSSADLAHQATTDTTPTISGWIYVSKSSSGARSIDLYMDGQKIQTFNSSTTYDANIKGFAWSYTLTAAQAASVGNHVFTAKRSDSNNNNRTTTYTLSSSYGLAIDAPTAVTPVITDLTSASWTGSSSADLASQGNHALAPHTTADSTPALSGTAGKLATLNVYDGATLLGYTTADASGNWSYQVPDYLLRNNGSHNFTVKDVTAGNNISSAGYALTIDSTAPTQTVSVDSLSADTGSDNHDFITATTSQTINATLSSALLGGQKLMGSLDGGASWTDITASVNGTAVAWTGQALRTGYADPAQYVPWAIQMKVVDPANLSSALASQDYQLLNSGGTPTISTVASSVAASVTTNYSYPVITGTGDADTVVDIYATPGGGTATLLGTVAVDRNGNWSLSPSAAMGNGSYTLEAVERNTLSGYTSPNSVARQLTINTSLPLLTLNSTSDSGVYNSDAVTNSATPSVRVNFANIGVGLTAGTDTVTIRNAAGTSVGSATVSSANVTNRYVDISTSNLGADALEQLTAVVTHTGTSYTSNELSFTLDKTGPQLGNLRVDGDTVSLSISEAVGLTPVTPDLATFTVKVNGSAVTTDSLSYDPVGKTMQIVLVNAVGASDTVSVSYTPGGGNNLVDLAGNAAISFSAVPAINVTDTAPPTLTSIVLQTPGSGPTNASAVTFRVTFADTSGGVAGVDTSDFVADLGGTTVAVTNVSQVSGLMYDVTVADPALASANGTLTLGLATTANGMDIVDVSAASNALANSASSANVVLDHIAPVAPGLLLASDSGASSSDGHTASGVVNVSGVSAGNSWQYSSDGGSNWATGTGSSFTLSGDGAKSVQVRQTDNAGNVSASSGALAFNLDTTAPTIASATVDGNTLVLTLTEGDALDSVNAATTSAFGVLVGGSPVGVDNVVVDAAAGTITLTLASAVRAGQVVSVSYTDPSAGNDAAATQDLAGNDMASFSGRSASNITFDAAPTVSDVSVSGAEDAPTITVTLAGSDSDGTITSYTLTALPTHGRLYSDAGLTTEITATNTSVGSATLYFVPDADWHGSTSLTYTATDDGGATSATTATAQIDVAAVNDAPATFADARTTAENSVLNASVPLGSDVDAPPEIQDTGPLDFSITNRTFSFYGPETSSNEFDVNAGSGPTGFGSAAAMAAAFQAHPNYALLPYTIGVNAAGDGLQLDFKTPGNFGTRGLEKWGDGPSWLTTVREGQDLSYAVVNDVPAGQGTLSFNANGSYTFDPGSDFDDLAAGESRDTSFTYTATDPFGATSVARTVTITVTGVDDAAVITGTTSGGLTETDAAQTTGGTLGATDVDSSAAFVAQTGVAGSNGHGSFSIDAAGAWTYTMNSAHDEFVSGSTYTDSIRVTTADGTSQDITVTITGTNDAPTAAAVSAGGLEDAASIGITLSGGDSDGSIAGYRVDTLPAHGTLYRDAGLTQLVAAGTAFGEANLYFVPDADWSGSASFDYITTDNDGADAATSATASIVVAAVNDAPQIRLLTDASLLDASNTTIDTSTVVGGEGGRLSAPPGTIIAYGMAGYDSWAYAIVDSSGSIDISNGVFGDPLPGVPKLAYIATSTLGGIMGGAITEQAGTSHSATSDVVSGHIRFADVDLADSHGVTAQLATSHWTGGSLSTDQISALSAAFTLGSLADNNGTGLGSQPWRFDIADSALDFVGAGQTLTLTFAVTVADAQGASATQDITVTITGRNDAPEAPATLAAQGAVELTPVAFTLPADAFGDADAGDALTLSATLTDGSALPAWLHFDATTGSFSGTPGDNDAGVITVRVSATDLAGASTSSDFALTVAASNAAPSVANPIADMTTAEDEAFAWTVPGNTFADVDLGDTLTYTATLADGSALPSWLTFDATTRTFSGTPANGDVGAIDVKVVATDAAGAPADDTFRLTVGNVNDTPTLAISVVDQAATEDQPFSFQVPAGTFADVDAGDTLTYTATLADGSALPSWLTFDAATRTFSGTPANGDVGAIDIQVMATDGSNASADDTFKLTVGNVNDAPVAAADSASTPAGTTVTIDVLANDSDMDGDVLSIRSASVDPAEGTVDIVDGKLVYTPASGFSGNATISYVASDGTSDAAPATVTVRVDLAPNTPPSGVDGHIAMDEDASHLFSVADFGFVDAESASLDAVRIDSLPAHGVLELNGNAVSSGQVLSAADIAGLVYIGAPDANGSEGFTFSVRDTDGAFALAPSLITIDIAPVNDAPVAADAQITTALDSAVDGSLPGATDTDNDAVTYLLATTPSDGELTLDPSGSYVYTPRAGFNGYDSFSYTVEDGQGGSNTYAVSITVGNVEPRSDAVTLDAVAEDSGARLITQAELLANTRFIDAFDLAASNLRIATGAGNLQDNGDGSWTYTPTPDDDAAVTFAYDVSGSDVAVTGSATLDITPLNDAPTSAPVTLAAVAEDSGARIITQAELLAHADDIDHDSLTITNLAISSGAGSLIANDDGSWTYTPAANDDTSVSFSYLIGDGTTSVGGSATLDITPVDDAAVIAGDTTRSVTEGNSAADIGASGTLTSSDVDGTANLFVAQTGVAGDQGYGTFSIGSNGVWSYTASSAHDEFVAGNHHTDSITVTTADGTEQVITVDIQGSNDATSISGTSTANLTETNAALGSGGTLAAIDPDGSYAFTAQTDVAGDHGYGNFSIDAGGSWTYTMDSAHNEFVAGTSYTDSITVTTADGTRQDITVTITGSNDVPDPTLPLAPPQAVKFEPYTYTVPAGSFGDLDGGDVLTLSATLADGSSLPSWLNFDATTRSFSGTPDSSDTTGITVRVTATDLAGTSAWSDFRLTVVDSNSAPTLAISVADQSAIEDAPFSFELPSGTFADVDAGDTLSYTATRADGSALPAWLHFDATTRTFSGRPANGDVGAIDIKLVATDRAGAIADDTFTLTVGNVNDAPTLAITVADQSATEDVPFTFQLPGDTFADVDAGDPLSYTATRTDGSALPAWLHFDAATRTFSGTPTNDDVGAIDIKLVATDRAGATAEDSFTLTVGNVNDAPMLAITLADQSATEDVPFTFELPGGTFADVDAGDTLSYSATRADGSPLPSWLHFDADTRTFSGTPGNGDVGAMDIKLLASDRAGATAEDSFTLTVGNVNDAPTLATTVADQSATEDVPFSFQLPAGTFADVDAGDTLSFTATRTDGSALPAWLHFDTTTRTFSGTPANGDVGAIDIKLVATDRAGATADDTFTLTVGDVNDAPTLAMTVADQSATEDAPLIFQLPTGTFADVDTGDTLSYSATRADGSALPAWLHFDATTRAFSGTPANGDVGAIDIKLVATDRAGATSDDTFTLTVGNVNDAPTLAITVADQSATEDVPFAFQLPADTFADVDAGDTLSFTATRADGSALPAWLHFDASTRTFSGTPGNGDVGAVDIKLVASDRAGAVANDTFTLSVGNVNDAPTLAITVADQSATEDAPFSFQLPSGTFADVDAGDTLSYSATRADGSALPAWLHFDAATRAFSGTPANGDVGAIDIKLVAIDRAGAIADDTFTLTVGNTNDAPVSADSSAELDEDTPLVARLPSVQDIDGDTPSYVLDSAPAHGHVALQPDGSYVYTPAANYTGSDSFSYVVSDGHGGSNHYTLSLLVRPVNDAPDWAAPGATTGAENTPLTGQLPTANDVEGDQLSYAKAGDPAHGSVSVAADGSWVYTPAAGYHGSDSFQVSVDDGQGGKVVRSVSVNLLAAPTITLQTRSDLGSSSSDRITSAPEIVLEGQADANQTLRLYGPQGQLLGEVRSDATGRWSMPGIRIDALRGDDGGKPAGAPGVYGFSVRLVLPTGQEGAASHISVTREIPQPTVAEAVKPVTTEAPARPATEPAQDAAPTGNPQATTMAEVAPRAETPSASHDNTPATQQRSATEGDIYTRASGFQVMVTPAAEPSLKLFRGVEDQIVPMNRTLIVQVPADAFVHTVITETITLLATKADGQPLPVWLSFDGKTGKFFGEPPAAGAEDLAIRITARDSAGREVTTMFHIKVAEGRGTGTSSRASFTQQLARGEALTLKPGQRAWTAQPRELAAAGPTQRLAQRHTHRHG